MQFYTVVLQNLHMVSRFDAKGRKIGETHTWVEQTMHDLPLQTAQMYIDKDTTGKAKMFPQEPTRRVTEHRRHEVRFGDVKAGKSMRAEPVRTAAAKKPAVTPASKTHEAARTGDMAAAINQE
jgi:hypothetical protein